MLDDEARAHAAEVLRVIAITARSLEPALRALASDIEPGSPGSAEAWSALSALRTLVRSADSAQVWLAGGGIRVDEARR